MKHLAVTEQAGSSILEEDEQEDDGAARWGWRRVLLLSGASDCSAATPAAPRPLPGLFGVVVWLVVERVSAPPSAAEE